MPELLSFPFLYSDQQRGSWQIQGQLNFRDAVDPMLHSCFLPPQSTGQLVADPESHGEGVKSKSGLLGTVPRPQSTFLRSCLPFLMKSLKTRDQMSVWVSQAKAGRRRQ